jgi:hypothetical protein
MVHECVTATLETLEREGVHFGRGIANFFDRRSRIPWPIRRKSNPKLRYLAAALTAK